MTWKIIIILGVLAAGVVLCGSYFSTNTPPHNIRIGIIAGEIDSEEFANGANLAAERLNHISKSVKIDCVIHNNVKNIHDAHMSMSKLTAENCQAVIVHTDVDLASHLLPLFPALNQVAIFTTMPHGELNAAPAYRNCFATMFSYESYNLPLLEYMQKQKLKRALLLSNQSMSWARKQANCFEKNAYLSGITVVNRIMYQHDQPADILLQKFHDLKTYADFDCIVVFDVIPNVEFLLTAIRSELSTPVLTIADMSESTSRLSGRLATPLAYCSYNPEKQTERQCQDFVAAYQARFGHIPHRAAYCGYDAVNILHQAFVTAKSAAPDDIAHVMRSLKKYPDSVGFIDFEGKRTGVFSISIIPARHR